MTRLMRSVREIADKPATSLLTAAALTAILGSLTLIVSGDLYIAALEYADATTVIMAGALILRFVFRFRGESDLTAFSLSLIGALSFLFCFEAVYKLLFFGWVVRPEELRWLILHTATALTVTAGLASGHFRISLPVVLWFGIFALIFLFWCIAGYPQGFYKEFTPGFLWIPVGKPEPMTDSLRIILFLVGRVAKGALFMCYFMLPRDFRRDEKCRAPETIGGRT